MSDTKITFLGAMNEVGASGIMVEYGRKSKTRIVMDYGTNIQNDPPTFPYSVRGKIDATFLSHAHLDHTGGIPILFNKGRCPIYAPAVNKPLVQMLLNDSLKISRREQTRLPFDKKHVRKAIKNFKHIDYRRVETIGKKNYMNVTVYDAGHIPGSTMPLIETKDGKKILYTGDFNVDDTELLKGADTRLPKVDVLITESTYAERDHPDRLKQEKILIDRVRQAVENGGTAIISSFALGRTQEMLLVLDKYGIDYPLYMDGMSKKATTILNSHPRFLREATSIDKALRKVKYVNNNRQRKKAIKDPSVILTTSGMLNGGPVVWYLKKLHNNKKNNLTLTGYQVEGTAGHTLLNTGRFILDETDLKLNIDYKRLEFSSHTGREKLFSFIKKLDPQKVFCVHGDNTPRFADELKKRGYDAVAPVKDNRVFGV